MTVYIPGGRSVSVILFPGDMGEVRYLGPDIMTPNFDLACFDEYCISEAVLRLV